MLITLPKIYNEIEEELDSLMIKLANKHNIRLGFIMDSKGLQESKERIAHVFVRLKQNVKAEFTEDQLKDFSKLKSAMKKSKKRERKR